MDPEACLEEAVEALVTGDKATFQDRVRSYTEWRHGLGFEPTVTVRGDVLSEILSLIRV